MAEANSNCSDEVSYVSDAASKAKTIRTEAAQISEGVSRIQQGLESAESGIEKLPNDGHGANVRVKLSKFKDTMVALDSAKKPLVAGCESLASGWDGYEKYVRKIGKPISLQDTKEMMAKLKTLLSVAKDCHLKHVIFLEKLNTARRSCRDAEESCAEAAAKEKKNVSSTAVIGGVTTAALAGVAVAAAVVASGGTAAVPIAVAARTAAVAKVAAAGLGVGAGISGGVTMTLVGYQKLAEHFTDSKKTFNSFSTELEKLGDKIISLQKATEDLIRSLKAGQELHMDRLADKEKVEKAQHALEEIMKEKNDAESELARYRSMYGRLN